MVFFLISVSDGRRCGCAKSFAIHGGFPDFAGGDRISVSYELTRPGVLVDLDLVEFVFWSSHCFSGDASVDLSGEQAGSFMYQLVVKLGWLLSPPTLVVQLPFTGLSRPALWGFWQSTGRLTSHGLAR
ncbi:unnamed protein product [Urochloa humidicola]